MNHSGSNNVVFQYRIGTGAESGTYNLNYCISAIKYQTRIKISSASSESERKVLLILKLPDMIHNIIPHFFQPILIWYQTFSHVFLTFMVKLGVSIPITLGEINGNKKPWSPH